jgi:uncharacterized protein YkwD
VLTTTLRRLAAAAVALGASAALLVPVPSASAATTAAPPFPVVTFTHTHHKDWAKAVFAQLNAERARHGLPALRWNENLYYAAHRHTLLMGQAGTLSHQLPGEESLGTRVAYFYRWSAVGENVAVSSNRTQAGALALESMMYAEVPPNDGHRRNILSTTYTDVGVDVVDDATHGRVWLTTDFGRLR